MSTGPNRHCPSGKNIVGTPYPPAATTRWCSASTSSLVVGSAIAWSTSPGSRPISSRRCSGDGLLVRLVSVDVQCLAGPAVPGVQVVHRRAAQQCADAHHRPAVGPFPFPRVLLAVQAVDLLEAEEPPVHREPGQFAHLADPERCLIRVRAHDVEVEVDGFGLVRHIVNLRLRAARSPSSASPFQLIAPESIAPWGSMRPQASWMNVVESVMISTSGLSRWSTRLALPSTATLRSRTIGPVRWKAMLLPSGRPPSCRRCSPTIPPPRPARSPPRRPRRRCAGPTAW